MSGSQRYVVRVVFADHGGVGFLRHGPISGTGPIVRYKTKAAAERALSALVTPGLGPGDVAQVVPLIVVERAEPNPTSNARQKFERLLASAPGTERAHHRQMLDAALGEHFEAMDATHTNVGKA